MTRPPFRLVLAAMVAAAMAVWAGMAAADALRVELPDGRGAAVTSSPATPPAATRRSASDSLVRRASALDPFRVGRRRAAAAPSFFSGGAAVSPRAVLRLVGTVVEAGGDSFAMCQLGDEPARAVRVGERIGDHRLRAVRQGVAEFVGPDGPITLHVPRP